MPSLEAKYTAYVSLLMLCGLLLFLLANSCEIGISNILDQLYSYALFIILLFSFLTTLVYFLFKLLNRTLDYGKCKVLLIEDKHIRNVKFKMKVIYNILIILGIAWMIYYFLNTSILTVTVLTVVLILEMVMPAKTR